jgi:hypothetical protein
VPTPTPSSESPRSSTPGSAGSAPAAAAEATRATTLDFIEDTGDIKAQHDAFLVGEEDFDAIRGRLEASGRQWWAGGSGTDRIAPARRTRAVPGS